MPVETSVSQSAVYRARPTLRLAGQEDVRVSELLIGMRIEESEGGMTTAELRFSNWASTTDNRADHAFEDGSRITLGTAIEVYAGDETQARELFRGVVSGLEAEFAQGAPPEPCDTTIRRPLPRVGTACQASSKVNTPRLMGCAGAAVG